MHSVENKYVIEFEQHKHHILDKKSDMSYNISRNFLQSGKSLDSINSVINNI